MLTFGNKVDLVLSIVFMGLGLYELYLVITDASITDHVSRFVACLAFASIASYRATEKIRLLGQLDEIFKDIQDAEKKNLIREIWGKNNVNN